VSNQTLFARASPTYNFLFSFFGLRSRFRFPYNLNHQGEFEFMGRIILGVIVGFIAWSIIWVGGDETFGSLLPDWYGTQKLAFEKAAFNKTPFDASSSFLLFKLIHSIVTSVISGYLAAFISKENNRTTLILGILLLAVGIYFESTYWSQLPIWYHLVFLILLIPMTIAGGKLKKPA
jgi:uncharacterized membrane protein YeaQ/YmgE (transglycosylase-associated protein family)